MINPYREAAPWARAITLVLIGAALLYGLGRWDQHVNAQLRDLTRETRVALRATGMLRAHRDSLKRVEDSLEAVDAALAVQERRTALALAELDSLAQVEADSLEVADLASLLQPLRMRPILQEGDTLYATDERGVRFLSERMLRLDQTQRELVEVRRLSDVRSERIASLLVAVGVAQDRADTAEARVAEIEPLLERWQEVGTCKILWFIPCPSRTTAFVVGAIGGGLAVYIGTKE